MYIFFYLISISDFYLFVSVDSGESLVVRTCVLEDIASGGVQCGNFRFQGNPENDTQVTMMSGCILTCDYDGCNHSDNIRTNQHVNLISLFVLYMLYYNSNRNR